MLTRSLRLFSKIRPRHSNPQPHLRKWAVSQLCLSRWLHNSKSRVPALAQLQACRQRWRCRKISDWKIVLYLKPTWAIISANTNNNRHCSFSSYTFYIYLPTVSMFSCRPSRGNLSDFNPSPTEKMRFGLSWYRWPDLNRHEVALNGFWIHHVYHSITPARLSEPPLRRVGFGCK